jgi:hypothetical protein
MKRLSLGMTSPSPIFGSLERAVQVIADLSPDEVWVPVSRTAFLPGSERLPSIRML